MRIDRYHLFRIAGLAACLLFGALLAVRVFWLESWLEPSASTLPPEAGALEDRETWMNVLQNGRKIGYSHFRLSGTGKGYRLQETMFMRINTMGVVQNLGVRTEGNLKEDLSLDSFDFEIRSGVFQFRAQGRVDEGMLAVSLQGPDHARQVAIPLDHPVYLAAGVLEAAIAGGLKPGDVYSFPIFDPATLGQETITLKVAGREEVIVASQPAEAVKVLLSFKEAEQAAWIDAAGEVIKESGLLGISLEKTTREDALYPTPDAASQDLTLAASIDAGRVLADPAALEGLKVRLTGIPHDRVQLQGGRQELDGDILSISRERIEGVAAFPNSAAFSSEIRQFLDPSPFIQSDAGKIIALAENVAPPEIQPLEKARRLVKWVFDNLEKKPVISLPDALSTLERGTGDCNEHAVLLAALARAAGVPARVEAGLVYQGGRFYYHAWNLLYVGEWITADATFGQLPADVTHIRFTSGAQKLQLDLMGTIGKVGLEILEVRPEGGISFNSAAGGADK